MHEGEDQFEPEMSFEAGDPETEPAQSEGALEREARGWCGGRGFDEAGYGYGAYAASDDG